MAKKTPSPYAGKMTPAQVAEMMAHRGSGAAGVHADQRTRKAGTGRTNRVSTRSAAKKQVISEQL